MGTQLFFFPFDQGAVQLGSLKPAPWQEPYGVQLGMTLDPSTTMLKGLVGPVDATAEPSAVEVEVPLR